MESVVNKGGETMTFEKWWSDHGRHNAAAKGCADRGVKELMRLAFDVGQEQKSEAVAAERERWKAMMQRAIATCFHERAHLEVLSDPAHFAAEALRA